MSHYLDSRDLQRRLDELIDLRDRLAEARREREELGANPASTAAELERAETVISDTEMEFGEDEAAELTAIEELAEEVGSEWRHGVTLIPEGSFVEYAQELAEDIGAIPRDAAWPARCIDWEQAANELGSDYQETTFRGETYLYR